ncbi:hypothetical protein ACIQ7Q_24885 [Streptomyces sp. NPDC096176]|uniref:hypothetical protein n=1 Tax=Streptomyces sp. NPDC096176 TaxID=3366079 RepID=UPI00380E2C2B
MRILKEEGLIYSVQGRGVFVRQLSPRDQFLKRYNETLEEAQRRADEEAVRLSGKSDDEVAAELAAAEERFAKASTECEAAIAHRDAMRASGNNASASAATTHPKRPPPRPGTTG